MTCRTSAVGRRFPSKRRRRLTMTTCAARLPRASSPPRRCSSGVWLAPALLQKRAPTFRDQGDFFFPLKLYTADRLRAGRIPLWNPLSGCGEPWLANGAVGRLLSADPPLPPSLAGARGGRSFSCCTSRSPSGARGGSARRRTSRTRARLLGAAAFAASGLAASLSAYWNHFGAFAYLPGIAALRAIGPADARRGRWGWPRSWACRPWRAAPRCRSPRSPLAVALALRRGASSRERLAALPRAARLRRLAAAAGSGWRSRRGCSCRWGSSRCARTGAPPLPAAERDSARCTSGAAAAALGGRLGRPLGRSLLPRVALSRPRRPRRVRRGASPSANGAGSSWILAAFALAGILLAAPARRDAGSARCPPLDRVRYPAKCARGWTLFAAADAPGLGFDALRFCPRGASRIARGRLPGARRRGVRVPARAACRFAPPPAAGARRWRSWRSFARGVAAGGRRRARGGGRARPRPGSPSATSARFRVRARGGDSARPDAIELLSRRTGPHADAADGPRSRLGARATELRRGDGCAASARRCSATRTCSCGVRTLRTAAAAAPTAAPPRSPTPSDAAEDALPAGAASARVLWTPFPPGRSARARLASSSARRSSPIARDCRSCPATASRRTPGARGRASRRRRRLEGREVLLDREPVAAARGGRRKATSWRASRRRTPGARRRRGDRRRAGLLVLTDLAYPGWTARGRSARGDSPRRRLVPRRRAAGGHASRGVPVSADFVLRGRGGLGRRAPGRFSSGARRAETPGRAA